MPPQEGAILGCLLSGRLKNTVKHRILGVGKEVSCSAVQKNRWSDLNDLYVV